MDEIRRIFASLLVLAGLLAGCASPQTVPTSLPTAASGSTAPAYWPTQGWRSTTPEEQGLDSEKLAEMLAHIQSEKIDLHSLLVVRNGFRAAEVYGHPYTAEQTHWVASVTKPVVSALVGIAIQRGQIRDVRQPLFSLLPEAGVKNLDENKKKITLENLLSMTSGLDCIDNLPLAQPRQNPLPRSGFEMESGYEPSGL